MKLLCGMGTNMKIQNIKFLLLIMALPLTVVPMRACVQTTAEGSANPDQLTVRLSNPSQPARIKLQTLGGTITVQGYSGNEVIIKGTAERNRESGVRVPDEARGMRRLTPAGGLSADEESNVVTIHPGLKPENIDLQVPAASALSLKTLTGNVLVNGVLGDLDLESMNGGITLDQVGGSIVAHALNGGISANVVRLNADKPCSFSTLNGRIELTLPASIHANLTMRSDQGDVYLDQGFDFKAAPASSSNASTSESNGMLKIRMDNTIHGTINGGGVEINIRTFNGNILVHKGT
jgi:Putative adhesin